MSLTLEGESYLGNAVGLHLGYNEGIDYVSEQTIQEIVGELREKFCKQCIFLIENVGEPVRSAVRAVV